MKDGLTQFIRKLYACVSSNTSHGSPCILPFLCRQINRTINHRATLFAFCEPPYKCWQPVTPSMCCRSFGHDWNHWWTVLSYADATTVNEQSGGHRNSGAQIDAPECPSVPETFSIFLLLINETVQPLNNDSYKSKLHSRRNEEQIKSKEHLLLVHSYSSVFPSLTYKRKDLNL
jgi:hypothetical protein